MIKGYEIIKMVYGLVDNSVLKKFQQEFDILVLLVIVDEFDQVIDLLCLEDGLCDELFCLYGMVYIVLNGVGFFVLIGEDLLLEMVFDIISCV